LKSPAQPAESDACKTVVQQRLSRKRNPSMLDTNQKHLTLRRK
jgi:hypothetical protein